MILLLIIPMVIRISNDNNNIYDNTNNENNISSSIHNGSDE